MVHYDAKGEAQVNQRGYNFEKYVIEGFGFFF